MTLEDTRELLESLDGKTFTVQLVDQSIEMGRKSLFVLRPRNIEKGLLIYTC